MYEIFRKRCNFWYSFYDTATMLNVNTPDTKHKWKLPFHCYLACLIRNLQLSELTQKLR